ncbi:hypothetical protein QBC39DRAFT_344435 [Podospora conica]|nr:hypothetical protein QBC39DRAFT_344435 [Schizothecium conicum]
MTLSHHHNTPTITTMPTVINHQNPKPLRHRTGPAKRAHGARGMGKKKRGRMTSTRWLRRKLRQGRAREAGDASELAAAALVNLGGRERGREGQSESSPPAAAAAATPRTDDEACTTAAIKAQFENDWDLLPSYTAAANEVTIPQDASLEMHIRISNPDSDPDPEDSETERESDEDPPRPTRQRGDDDDAAVGGRLLPLFDFELPVLTELGELGIHVGVGFMGDMMDQCLYGSHAG